MRWTVALGLLSSISWSSLRAFAQPLLGGRLPQLP